MYLMCFTFVSLLHQDLDIFVQIINKTINNNDYKKRS
jgi:hypothetical protein